MLTRTLRPSLFRLAFLGLCLPLFGACGPMAGDDGTTDGEGDIAPYSDCGAASVCEGRCYNLITLQPAGHFAECAPACDPADEGDECPAAGTREATCLPYPDPDDGAPQGVCAVLCGAGCPDGTVCTPKGVCLWPQSPSN